MITETDRIAAALDLAALTWPDESSERTALLRHIIDEGILALEQRQQTRIQERMAFIEGLKADAKFFENLWPENWREDQLAGWPE